jgi:hypothetical protein
MLAAMSGYSLLGEARDARTAPDRLARLAALSPHATPPGLSNLFEWAAFRPLLLDLIAGNPNGDHETLFSLLPGRPVEVLTNPAFELLLLEAPALLLGQPTATRLAVARCPEAPEAAIRSLLGDTSEEIQEALAAHPHTPPEALCAFTMSSHARVRSAAASRPELPAGWLARLIRAGSTPSLDAWSGEHGEMSEEELRSLLAAGEWGRCLVARHPQTPPSWFRRLGPTEGRGDSPCGLPGGEPRAEWHQQAEAPLVRRALASNPRLPGAMLAALAEDPDLPVQQAVAQNPSVAAEVLGRLAERHLSTSWVGQAEGVLLRVARHPSAPPSSLRLLATCGRAAPAQAALGHPRLDPAWRDLVIASGLVPGAGQGGTRELSDDELIQLTAGAAHAQLFVAAHPRAPREALRWLGVHAREQVQAAVAVHPSLDEETKRSFVASGSGVVLQAIAGAASLPDGALDQLVETARRQKHFSLSLRLLGRADLTVTHCLDLSDPSGLASAALRTQSSLPGLAAAFAAAGGHRLQALLESPLAPPATLSFHARSAEWRRRQAVAGNLKTPPDALALLAADEDARVRGAVAANPLCPEEQLSLLASDEAPRVQQLARKTRKAREERGPGFIGGTPRD